MSDVIGIDVGGTFIKAGRVDTKGNIVKELDEIPTEAEQGPKHVISQIIRAVKELSIKEALLVGIGTPGIISLDRSTVKYPPNLPGWEVIDLGKEIGSAVSTRVVVDNDANCAALGEAMFGAGKNIPSFVLATLGTGVGGGIIIDGKIFRGETGGAGEIGHSTIDYNGPQCNCGSFGCVETYIGRAYFARRVAHKLETRKDSLLHELLKDGGELTPEIISRAANKGDAFAYEELREAGYYLGVGLANVMGLFDIHTAILGGGIAQAGEPLFEGVRRAIVQFSQPPIAESFALHHAALGNNAGILGAAALVL